MSKLKFKIYKRQNKWVCRTNHPILYNGIFEGETPIKALKKCAFVYRDMKKFIKNINLKLGIENE